MKRLEVSGAIRLIYRSLGLEGLRNTSSNSRVLTCAQANGAISVLAGNHQRRGRVSDENKDEKGKIKNKDIKISEHKDRKWRDGWHSTGRPRRTSASAVRYTQDHST